jgi:hypothetical protein
MGRTFHLLATESDVELLLRWFGDLPAPPEVTHTPTHLVLYFRSLGPLVQKEDDPGAIDPTRSPIVTVFPPLRRRAALLTAAEVHFLTTMRQFAEMKAVSRAFQSWLHQFERVFSRQARICEWDNYLEGSIRNFAEDVFALPSAMEALRRGQYFVAADDTDFVVDKLCRALRLRGVEGITD